MSFAVAGDGVYGSGVAVTQDELDSAFAATAIGSTRPRGYDFGDDDSWQTEVQDREDDSIMQQHLAQSHQQQPTAQQQRYSPAQSQAALQHHSPAHSQWLETDDPSFSQFQSRPQSSSGGRGRGDRARFVVHDPVGAQFEVAYAQDRPSDTTVAPTYSVDHGMNLYNPNEISWAGSSIPPPDARGLQVPGYDADHQQHTLQSDDWDELQQQHSPQQQQQHQQPRHSRPSSRTGHRSQLAASEVQHRPSRPQSRSGYLPEHSTDSHLQYHPAASSSHRHNAREGEFETVYAEPRPSDTSVAPTYSAKHGMNLYNPNEISWAGGIPPSGQTGLRARTPQPGSYRTHEVEGEGETHRSENLRQPAANQQQHGPEQPHLRQQESPTTPVFDQAPLIRSKVSIDQNGNRVVHRYVDSSHATSPLTTSLPPVTINPATGLPHPVFSATHGTNLYIPSEISWAAGSVPPVGHFDRGFRQPQHQQLGTLQAPRSRTSASTSPSGPQVLQSTLGQRVQVSFELDDSGSDPSQNEGSAPIRARPISAARQQQAFSTSAPLIRSTASSPIPRSTSDTPPPLRALTVGRAHDALLAQAGPVNLTPRGASDFAPIVTEFETVYADDRQSDTSAAPTYSAEHGMNLYNPNQVSWAGGTPPSDRTGLRAHQGPVRAFASSRPGTGSNSPMPRQLSPLTPASNQVSPSSSTGPSSPPRFRRRPSGDASRVIGARQAVSHPEWNSSPLGSEPSPGTQPRSRPGSSAGRVTKSPMSATTLAPPSTSPSPRSPLSPAGGAVHPRSPGSASPRSPAPRVPTSAAPAVMDGFVQTQAKGRSPRLAHMHSPSATTSPSSAAGSPSSAFVPRPPSAARSPSSPAQSEGEPGGAPPPRKFPKGVRMDF